MNFKNIILLIIFSNITLFANFTLSEIYIKEYKTNTKLKKYMTNYLDLIKNNIDISSQNLELGLRLIRLSDCIKETSLENIMEKEILQKKLSKNYIKNIIRPQLWWRTTMRMKLNQEGFSDETKDFLKCGFKMKGISGQDMIKDKPTNIKQLNKLKIDINKDIIKYGFNKRLPKDINDKINKENLPKGYTVNIKPHKEGFKIIYTGLKKGTECYKFSGLNFNNTILSINEKSYKGFDSTIINNKKIKISRKPNAEYIKSLCMKKEINTIIFIKNKPFEKYSYDSTKPRDIFITAFDKLKRIQYIDKNTYNANGFSLGENKFIVSGNLAKIYDLNSLSKIQDVNRIKYRQVSKSVRKMNHRLESSFSPLISPKDNKAIALRYGNKIQIFNIKKDVFDKTIIFKDKIRELNFFLNEELIVMRDNKRVILYNINKEKEIFSINPKFNDFSQKYRTTYIEKVLLSNDKKKIFISSNKNHIEVWSIDNNNFKYEKSLNIKYHIKSISTYPKDKNILILGFIGKDIQFWDINKDKLVRTLSKSKGYPMNNFIFSSNGKYMIGYGHSLYLWNLEKDFLVDFMKKDFYELKGCFFIPNSDNFITIDKDIEIWGYFNKKKI